MSISPPSDIVLDVARAADPARRQEAAARLTQLAAMRGQDASFRASATEPFQDVFEQTGVDGATDGDQGAARAPSPIIQLPFDAASTLNRLASDNPLGAMPAADKATEPLRQFEAMVLSSFVETMLPENSDALFGAGSAGKMWQSLLAQQIAEQMASAGGVGIADSLASAHPVQTTDAGGAA